MSILQEILNWSEGLPAWQSDAIARLFEKEELSYDDMEDLFALLKSEHGIPDPLDRKARRLSADQIPEATPASVHVRLKAMKNLRHVNRIAENQQLTFHPSGLTVIYGDNGSGKSGYSRVLKRACRARDQSEPIHPDAFLPAAPTDRAEAFFEVEVNDAPDELGWIDGQPAPAVLSSLAVFDSRCARSYLDDEGDFAYVPYGLDILEGLAGACKKLKTMIETERTQSLPDKTVFADLAGDTAVGRLLSGLSHKTRSDQVESLATLTPAELTRYNELERNLKEGNPKEKAKQLRLLASRISKIAQNTTQKLAIVDDAALANLRELVEAYQAAQKAATLAAERFKEDASLLPGTGGEAWKELFQSARKFAVAAYPEKTFPDLGPDAQCPLCQQPLAEGAERFLRFEEFIQQDAEKTARERKKALSDASNVFASQNVTLGMDAELQSEMETLDKTLVERIRAFEGALTVRHAAIKKAMITQDWDTIATLLASPAIQLQSLSEKIGEEAAALEKLADEKARAVLQVEFNELDARTRLAKVKAAVLSAIERLDRQNRLTKCLSAVKSNAISLKASELAEKVVSKELEELLNQEFKNLGAGELQVCLTSRADKGKTIHKLKLNFPQAKKVGEILSEGEQRAIALGAFLAEVRIGGSTGGIVFDDPVSSLDHRRREKVARRLAQEAAKRQVIIFTHDLYFLNLLVEEASKARVPIEKQCVIRRPEGFGVTTSDIPFEGMNTQARVGYLRNKQQSICKLYRLGDEQEHRKLTAEAYQLLRIAWERAVEEVLLRQVVVRFRKGIETQRLAGVVVEDPDYATVNRWMSKCSNYAHDQAILGGVEVPDPEELLNDINALELWRVEIDKRGKKLEEKRKAR